MMPNQKNHFVQKKQYKAFSLIEIAIVLVIIGLLAGAVLKGQDLLQNARLTTISSQINQYRLATHTFMDRYGALPGDFSTASIHIATHLKDGNGNGVIQGPGASPYSSNETHQATSFWAHLAAANLISDPGTKEGATGGAKHNNGSISPNHGIPSTKIGGGITITHNPQPNLDGHWFVIGTMNGPSTTGGLLKPKDALSIMQKMDTPDPLSGDVQVRNASGLSHGSQCLTGSLFNLKTTSPACVLYIKL